MVFVTSRRNLKVRLQKEILDLPPQHKDHFLQVRTIDGVKENLLHIIFTSKGNPSPRKMLSTLVTNISRNFSLTKL